MRARVCVGASRRCSDTAHTHALRSQTTQPSSPLPTRLNPMMDPTMVCVVLTGSSRNVASASQRPEAVRAQSMPYCAGEARGRASRRGGHLARRRSCSYECPCARPYSMSLCTSAPLVAQGCTGVCVGVWGGEGGGHHLHGIPGNRCTGRVCGTCTTAMWKPAVKEQTPHGVCRCLGDAAPDGVCNARAQQHRAQKFTNRGHYNGLVVWAVAPGEHGCCDGAKGKVDRRAIRLQKSHNCSENPPAAASVPWHPHWFQMH